MLGMTELERAMSKRIVDHDAFRRTVPEIVREHVPRPHIWLDTGCGTGGSIRDSINMFQDTQFVLADPSSENIAIAKETMAGEQRCLYVTNPTERLNFGDGTLDVITSIFSHHYYKEDDRVVATKNCYRMLKKGGLFVVSEHVSHPEDQIDADIKWKAYMRASGLPEPFIDRMISRRGTEYFPLSEAAHIQILKDIGFSEVGVFWSTCSDIGLYAVK